MSEKVFINWRDSSPTEFVFSVKISRFITHIKRLKNTEEPIANFMARARLLKEKLGPLLYQLPKNMKRDDQTFENFIQILPVDSCHVFEFRHDSWFNDKVFSLLRKYRVGFCIYDMPGFSTPIMATSDIAYIRFHGSQQLYGGCYPEKELEGWAERITDLDAKVVFAYFNNDIEGFAVRNATTLRKLLGTHS